MFDKSIKETIYNRDIGTCDYTSKLAPIKEMKKLILASILMINCYVFSQDSKYHVGMYLTYNDIIEKKSDTSYQIEVIKRTKGKIKFDGGNDYEIKSINKSINKNYFRKMVWAYSDGTDLYLNCFKYKLQDWYTKVLSDNEYYVFSAAIPLFPKKYGIKISEIPNMFGGIGGGLRGMKLALVRFPYIMNKSNQELTLVTERNIVEVIGNNKSLVEKYELESEKNNLEIIIKYLIEWNERE